MATKTILTTYGNNQILKAIAEETTVNVSAMVFGDGGGATYTPVPSQTALKNQIGRLNVVTKSFDPSTGFVYFSATIPSNVGGFTLREIGLIDENGYLLSVSVVPDTVKPDEGDSATVTLPLSIGFKTSVGNAMTVYIDATDTYATVEWVKEYTSTLSPDTDNITITKNADNKIQTVKIIDGGDLEAYAIRKVTQVEYEDLKAQSLLDDHTYYQVTDDSGTSGDFANTSLSNLLPAAIATPNKLGVVKPDGKSINITNDGTISAIARNIGEIVTSTIPLTDAGLHLLDGTLIQYGSYQAFVDYIADLYNNTPAEDVYNVNIVGSLTNDNGVLSGFTYGVYATIKEVPYSTADSIEILLKTTTGTLDSTNYNCLYSPVISNFRGVDLQINPNNKIQLYVSSNAGSSWDIVNGVVGTTVLQSNTQYYFKYVYTGTNHILYMSTTGAFAGEETTEVDVTNSSKPSNSAVSLGLQAWAPTQNIYYWRGSIDLKESYININSERWWSGKTERRTGFLTEDEWQQSVTDYGVCGKFVYDSVNSTVRLPKYSDKIYTGGGSAPVVGNGMTLGLTNGNSLLGVNVGSTANRIAILNNNTYGTPIGTVDSNYSSQTADSSVGVTTDPTKSGIIAQLSDITTSLDGYYYIVVATSAKIDIQVDIDEIATDLNGKADVDLTNVNDSGTSRGAGWAMPSGTYIDLTLGASGTTYTAPANGYFACNFKISNSSSGRGFATLNTYYKDTTIFGFNNNILHTITGHTQGATAGFIPIKKGDICQLWYEDVNGINQWRFYYAQGSEPTA